MKSYGYEKHRFVGLTEPESQEFTCGICLGIFCEPTVVPCCRQTYCYGCISEWLSNKNSCPNDRQGLTASQLYYPQRLVINLLAKLKIHCNFQSNGCQTVLDLEILASHADSCPYNPYRRCSVCDVLIVKYIDESQQFNSLTLQSSELSHNCINSLKNLNKSLENEISELKCEISKLKNHIKKLEERHVLSVVGDTQTTQSLLYIVIAMESVGQQLEYSNHCHNTSTLH
ncbi:E3 ubiquitin-protein ligase NRDP1-like [Oppia nitens]|uniref:E3 ubiquitin-protein ligase NRDP1-like n=1 Tax=Oppia nitens TaxID=1686743 RepID=UPI0023DB5B86|nr:E3 ubiquitin-protein ligase NRDP1-like [Oppia nitens]